MNIFDDLINDIDTPYKLYRLLKDNKVHADHIPNKLYQRHLNKLRQTITSIDLAIMWACCTMDISVFNNLSPTDRNNARYYWFGVNV